MVRYTRSRYHYLVGTTELPLRRKNVSDIRSWHTKSSVILNSVPVIPLFRLFAADLYNCLYGCCVAFYLQLAPYTVAHVKIKL